jgi:glycosyltransferase involved in cell wall biosynthesis
VTAQTLGLAIIARDEEESLPRLLASVEGAFDQVALLDTGSTDRTVEVFEEWAASQDLPLGHRVGRFEWRDDFAAARSAADALLDTDWTCWGDCDERALHVAPLREMVNSLPPEVAGVVCGIDAIGDGRWLPRARVARRGRYEWTGRVHELIALDGPAAGVPPPICAWVHTRTDWSDSDPRDERILRKWLADEPDNERALYLRSVPERVEAMA